MVYLPPSLEEDDWDSDQEEDGIADQEPLDLDWLTFQGVSFALSSLPGNRLGGARRSLPADLETIKREGIHDVFVLCTQTELVRCKVDGLIAEYIERGITVHHFPIEDGSTPSLLKCQHFLVDLHKTAAVKHKKALLQDGLGLSCLVLALYLMILDETIVAQEAIALVREMRGPSAIGVVKQYNFIMDFHRHCPFIRSQVLGS